MNNVYVDAKEFAEIWDDRYVKGIVPSVEIVDGSLMAGYFLAENLDDVNVYERAHPMQPNARVYTLSGKPGTKVMGVTINANGSRTYKQYLLK